ncbi:uncharacterized protein LOC111072191 [Drosophila obscura]|uniref:uncharacterized protein LOC111072191 n=1 Tax=Drosophila obscura TaxID=7282 RepID=UPI001BB27428|nr:uncharacterized protein LOC111072191 [Drosophila obscura]
MNPFLQHFLKHFLILISIFFISVLIEVYIAPRLPNFNTSKSLHQDANEAMVQDADSCTIEQLEDERYLKISCRMRQPRSVPTDYGRGLLFMVPNVSQHLPRQWNLRVPRDSVVGLNELAAKSRK